MPAGIASRFAIATKELVVVDIVVSPLGLNFMG
jgi:hypothetical protein